MTTYDIFLAPASRDMARAKELYRLLDPDLNVFLDGESLQPGDEWDREIPKAQRRSRMSVVLVSRAAEAAFYLREEIAAAIALQRSRPGEHRTIPVHLEGIPRDPMDIPYGLRVLHAIDLPAEGGLAAVAQRLRDLAGKLRGTPVPAEPAPASPPGGEIDAIGLHGRLCKLLVSQFETFLFLSKLPADQIPTQPAPIAQRALSAVQILQQRDAAAWEKALEALRQVTPGLV